MQPKRHAETVHHFRKLGLEGGLAGSAGVPAADHPERDSLAVDGQITIGNITLAEPHELTLYAAFLTGDGIRRVHLEMHIVVVGFVAQHQIFRQVQDVVGHFGHAVGTV